MSASENVVSRWARLKRNSEIQHTPQVVEDARQLSAGRISPNSAEATVAEPQVDALADEPFDPTSLPSIETITAATDISGFLQSRVPAGLTRAALRRAWASDPAIRDFIGIAENQWDFNDPDAIPGFGPLAPIDELPALLARALGRHGELAEMIAEMPVVVEPSLPVTEDGTADLDRSAQQASVGPPSSQTES